jgi:AcrR family transcriptional regulator
MSLECEIMPKETFFKITDEKRDNLLKAGIKIFSELDFQEVEVKMIVNLVGIPRGSFYAYFEDLEDYYSYIISQLQENRIREVEELKTNFEGDFFDFLVLMYEYDLKKFADPSRRLLQHHYFRYIQTIKKGSFSGTIYKMEKRRSVMGVLLTLPIINEIGVSLSEDYKHFIADMCMTVYLSTYNQAIQENIPIKDHLELFKNRIDIIEKGVKSC